MAQDLNCVTVGTLSLFRHSFLFCYFCNRNSGFENTPKILKIYLFYFAVSDRPDYCMLRYFTLFAFAKVIYDSRN